VYILFLIIYYVPKFCFNITIILWDVPIEFRSQNFVYLRNLNKSCTFKFKYISFAGQCNLRLITVACRGRRSKGWACPLANCNAKRARVCAWVEWSGVRTQDPRAYCKIQFHSMAKLSVSPLKCQPAGLLTEIKMGPKWVGSLGSVG